MLSRLRAALTRAGELFRRRSRYDADQDEEFRFHIEMETAENVRRGMHEADARRAAILRFGGQQNFREATRDARGLAAFDNVARDTRFAFRRIRRAPAFAIGVIATLGVGIGVAAGIGSIVYGVLLRDLPYPDPDQLVRVGFHTDGNGAPGDLHSAATYFHFAHSARSFTELGAYWTDDAFHITDGEAAERVTVALATPNMFTLLGARPVLGQLFEPGDTSWSNGRIPILISQELWERRYGGDPQIIGRRIELNRGARDVVGVLPRTFDFPSPAVHVWYPAAIPVRGPSITLRTGTVIGRLRDGVDIAAAESELNALVPTLSERFPTITPEMLRQGRARVSVTSLQAATVAPVRGQVVLLGLLVVVVLLIATTNVVNLFLLRTERASQEIAIALSLGATRARLAQRFVVEGMVLGLVSAVVALPAAALVVSTRFGFTEREIPRLHEVSFTTGTALLVLGVAMTIGAVVGTAALTRTRLAGLFDRLRASRSTPGRGWRGAQNGLVAFQVAIALTLLIAAGLLGRSFWNLSNANLGFDDANAMTFQVSLPWGPDGYGSYEQAAAFHARVADQLAALPGVTSVGVALQVPLTPTLGMHVVAGDEEGREPVAAARNVATPGYFHVMRIPLRAGRSFEAGDLRGVAAVVLSERLAKSVFGSTNVVGRTIRRPDPDGGRGTTFRVVGVVGDVHGQRIEDGYAPMAYFPLLRDGDGVHADSTPVATPRDVVFAIRGAILPASAIQRVVRRIDPRVPATTFRSLGSLVSDATSRVRLTMLLIAVAGAAALLLGVIGVYSVVSYAAAGRTREFGIRLALGAAPNRVGSMVLGDGLKLVVLGTTAGLLAAVGATRFLRALLYEVEPTSVAEFAMATTLLLVVTVIATLIPARRAARTHPGVVLRGE
ncbi:MAG TPA: ADOP family duplicated permease [Gemmatimonadaceae bacterium]